VSKTLEEVAAAPIKPAGGPLKYKNITSCHLIVLTWANYTISRNVHFGSWFKQWMGVLYKRWKGFKY